MIYDDIIIGGGTAGCVLACRLSENPDRKVLLIEAGPDFPDIDSIPHDILSSVKPTYSHDWEYVSEPSKVGRAIKLPRAKIMGGCSATNATAAIRGTKENYDQWASNGNEGWGYDDVLPYFCKLERDIDFESPYHGNDGPILITRQAPDELNRSFIETCQSSGYNFTEDLNAPGAAGIGLMPVNAFNGVRQSTALTYLSRARAGKNLTIKSGSLTDKIILNKNKAEAVLFSTGEKISGGRIIVSAGSYASPAILMRTGIGNEEYLKTIGIKTLINLNGVGNNLIDHPLIGLLFSAEPKQIHGKGIFQTALIYKSSEEVITNDLMIMPTAVMEAKKNLSPTGAFFIIFVSLLQPKSKGGVRIKSANPNDAPIIDLGYFTHPDDMKLMVEAVENALQFSKKEELKRHVVSEIFPGNIGKSVEESIIQRIETYHHPVGTCKMGNDDMAVVDVKLKVHGLENLYVVDASIMPNIPSANTNLSVIMAAERACEWLI